MKYAAANAVAVLALTCCTLASAQNAADPCKTQNDSMAAALRNMGATDIKIENTNCSRNAPAPVTINTHSTPEANLTAGIQSLAMGKLAAAAQYFRAGANQGDPACALNLAVMAHYGQSMPADRMMAGIWLDKSVEDGRILAPRALRYNFPMYLDLAKAGYPVAQYVAGKAYAEGNDGDRPTGNMEQAKLWLGKAAGQGNQLAANLLTEINTPRPQPNYNVARSTTQKGPSMYEQAMETIKRQNRENCEAAAKGRNRVCRF